VSEDADLADLALGRSQVRRHILRLLGSVPAGRLHLREIARRVETSPGTASRELGRLVAAGLAEREAEGNQVYFRASGSRLATTLGALLTASATARSRGAAVGVGPEPAVAPDWAATAGRLAAGLSSIYADRLRAVYLLDGTALARSRTARSAANRGFGPAGSNREAIGSDSLVARRNASSSRATLRPAPVVVLEGVEVDGEELERTSLLCASLALDPALVFRRVQVGEPDRPRRKPGRQARSRSSIRRPEVGSAAKQSERGRESAAARPGIDGPGPEPWPPRTRA